MADNEQQLDIPLHQQDESAVVLTTVGEPEPPMAAHTETIERDHEAVDTAQGDLGQAATFDGGEAPSASEFVSEGQVTTDDQAPNADATMDHGPITPAAMDVAQPEAEPSDDIFADLDMGDAQPISEESKLDEPIPDEQESNPLETQLAAESTTEEQATVPAGVDLAENTIETNDVPSTGPSEDANNTEAAAQEESLAEAGEVKNDEAGEDSADDLFGSDDEAPKPRSYIPRPHPRLPLSLHIFHRKREQRRRRLRYRRYQP
jgi:hypothetical protein